MKRLISGFAGEFPKVNEAVLVPNAATRCLNARLTNGGLRAFRGNLQYFTPTKPGTIRTIYRYAGNASDPNSGFLFHWAIPVDVIAGPIKEDSRLHVYWSGEGRPKYTWYDIATTDQFVPSNSYDLGIPAPYGAPTVIANPDGGADTTVEMVTRAWAITYVSPNGEEGPPVFTAEVTVWPDQTVTLSGLPTAPAGDYNLGMGAIKRIYRTATGDEGTGFYLEAEIAITEETFVSNLPDSALGGYLETNQWLEPPEDLHSLGVMANGIAYGAAGNTVYYAEQNLPHAWNPLNSDVVTHQVVGLGHYGNTIVALTVKNPYLITGYTPDAMSATEWQINQGCLSRASVCSGYFGALYASPDGLVLIGDDGYRIVTADHFDRDEWQALNPASIMGVIHEDKYFGFYDNGTTQGGFIIDPSNPAGGIVFLNFHATAAYSDPIADQLLLVVNNQVVAFDKGTQGQYVWRSKRNEEPEPVAFTAARIIAESYSSLTFRIWGDGVLLQEKTVTGRQIFRIPAPRRYTRWQIELEGSDEVLSVELAPAPGDIA